MHYEDNFIWMPLNDSRNVRLWTKKDKLCTLKWMYLHFDYFLLSEWSAIFNISFYFRFFIFCSAEWVRRSRRQRKTRCKGILETMSMSYVCYHLSYLYELIILAWEISWLQIICAWTLSFLSWSLVFQYI